MTNGPGPTVRRRQLGKELRRLREGAGKTINEAALWVGIKPPTVSKIENGRQAIRPTNVRLLLQLYGIGAPEADTLIRLAGEANQRGWWASYGDTVPDWFRTLEQVGNHAAAQQVLEVLATARLIVLDARSVEITHEAVLEAWPRLRDWIDEDRAGNLARQRLAEDAAVWNSGDRDSSLLYRGSRLDYARHLARTGTSPGLTGLTRDFLNASTRQWRRSVWTRRAAVATVVVFALIAAFAARLAIRQRDEAVFRQVMAEADRLQVTDPSLSAQLDLVAHQLRPRDNDVYTRLSRRRPSPWQRRWLGIAQPCI